METTTLKTAVKQAFGRNYSKPIIARLQLKGIKPLRNENFTEKIIQDIVTGKSKHFEAENEIVNLLQENKKMLEKLNKVLENKLTA